MIMLFYFGLILFLMMPSFICVLGIYLRYFPKTHLKSRADFILVIFACFCWQMSLSDVLIKALNSFMRLL